MHRMRNLKWKPSPAVIVAVLAISIALVGTASAGPIPNPIAQDSRLTKPDRRLAAKIARNISVRLIRRFTPRLTNRQITRRAPGLSVANAQNANGVNGGAITTDKLASDAVTGEKINESSTPFGRIVHETHGDSTQALDADWTIYPIENDSYRQDHNAINFFSSAITVRFDAGCAPPRQVRAFLLVDPIDPAAPTDSEIAGTSKLVETDGGAVTKRISLGGGSRNPIYKPQGSDQERQLYLVANRECDSGDGVSVISGDVAVIGVK